MIEVLPGLSYRTFTAICGCSYFFQKEKVMSCNCMYIKKNAFDIGQVVRRVKSLVVEVTGVFVNERNFECRSSRRYANRGDTRGRLLRAEVTLEWTTLDASFYHIDAAPSPRGLFP